MACIPEYLWIQYGGTLEFMPVLHAAFVLFFTEYLRVWNIKNVGGKSFSDSEPSAELQIQKRASTMKQYKTKNMKKANLNQSMSTACISDIGDDLGDLSALDEFGQIGKSGFDQQNNEHQLIGFVTSGREFYVYFKFC